MIIAGIEEAGRGPVIGPMVTSIVACEKSDVESLKLIGVDDSKRLSKKKRSSLFKDITRDFMHVYKIITPQEIDEALFSKKSNLNLLEAEAFAYLINEMKGKTELKEVMIDCPSTNTASFKIQVMKNVQDKNIRVSCEHKADQNYVIVGAASIISKVVRDEQIEKMKVEIGIDLGSGYPSDPKTIAFVKKYKNKFNNVRTSWSTYKKLTQVYSQQKITKFMT